MSLLEKIRKNSTIKETSILSESILFNEQDMIPTDIPMLNVALSGKLDGGLTPGVTMFAGPSKNFKTLFGLVLSAAYLKKYDDAVLMFLDTEFGTPVNYFNTLDIDMNRVVHIPIVDVEQLKFEVVNQLNQLSRTDNIIIVIDSIGNLASKKEVDDAIDSKSVADMSRAKSLKSFFRMITPHLSLKNIPMIVINHSYKELALFPKDIVSGGCLSEGTKIQLADGSYKAVEDFIVGDVVKTLDGDKEVTHTWNPENLDNGEPECYEVEFDDGYKVICSQTHKFLIDGNWIQAKDLIIGMDSSVY